MEQKVLMKTSKRCLYQISEANLEFYLLIPNARRVHLVLGLDLNINEYFQNEGADLADKAVVIPILSSQFLQEIVRGQEAYFSKLDQIFSFLINTAYKILTYNHLQVEQQIYFVRNNQYQQFLSWFLNKYSSRIMVIDFALNSDFTSSTNLSSSVASLGVINDNTAKKSTNGISNDVPASFTRDGAVNGSVMDQDGGVSSGAGETFVQSDFSEQKESISPTATRDLGFVSYVLLGVLAAVISLVFLYFII